jgi:hypothetical protein
MAQGPRGGWRWMHPVEPDAELAEAIEAFRQRKLAEIDAQLPPKMAEALQRKLEAA